MTEPRGQRYSRAKSCEFESVPITRYLAGAWPSFRAVTRSASGVAAEHQTCDDRAMLVQRRKKKTPRIHWGNCQETLTSHHTQDATQPDLWETEEEELRVREIDTGQWHLLAVGLPVQPVGVKGRLETSVISNVLPCDRREQQACTRKCALHQQSVEQMLNGAVIMRGKFGAHEK